VITTLLTLLADIAIFSLLGLAVLHILRRWWAGRPWLGVALAVTGIAALGWVAAMGAIVLAHGVRILVVVMVLAAAVYVVLARAWRVVTREILLTTGLWAAVAVLYVGVFFLFASPGDAYAVAEHRFVPFALPTDNVIPQLLAHRLEQGLPTHGLLGDWNGSDRPPLQSGLILIGQAPWPPGIDATATSFAPSVLAQLFWVPAAVSVLRSFGASPRIALPAAVFAAAFSTMLVNSLFTWPKLLSAALVLCAVAVLCDGMRRPRPQLMHLPVAVAAATLAMLAHGAAAFALPLLLVLGILLLRRYRSSWPRALLTAGGAAVVLFLPWTLFQRFVDPPGDRLLKWQLAGVVPIDGRSFPVALIDAYRALSVDQVIADKLSNVRTFLMPDVLAGLVPTASTAPTRATEEFFYLLPALGIALVIIAVMVARALVAAVAGFAAARSAGDRAHPRAAPFTRRRPWSTRGAMWPLVLVLPCLLFWCLALFGPDATVNHQGSYVWILLLVIVPFAWLRANAPRLAFVALAIQVAVTTIYSVPSPTGDALRPTALIVVAVGVLGVAVCWVATVTRLGSGREARSG